jgi:hypothetical protein
LHPSKNFAYPGVTYDPVTEDFVYPEVVAPPLPSNTEAGTWYESEQIFNNPSTGE